MSGNVDPRPAAGPPPTRKSGGFARLLKAGRHDYAGITHALRHDPAIRQVSVAVLVGVGVAACLPVGTVEKLLLVVTTLQVVLVEYLNSSIEAVVDRISTEHHPLAGHAKDLASVAVGLAVLVAGICWTVIAGPLLLAWLAARAAA
jgi:diacylglycerol kinase (ATP)